MRKIQIIGPKACLDECIKVLHAVAVVHFEPVPTDIWIKDRFFKKILPEKEKSHEKESLGKAAERLRNLLGLLKTPQSYETARFDTGEIPEFLEGIKPVEEKVKGLHSEMEELASELSSINKYEKILRGFAPIVSKLASLDNFDTTGLVLEKSRQEVVDLIEGEVNRITEGNYRMYLKELDETTFGIVITYPKKFGMLIKKLLSGREISELRLPDEYQDMRLLDALNAMIKKKGEIPELIEKTEKELENISSRMYGKVEGLLNAVKDAADEIEVLAYTAQTKFAFVVEGWVPADIFEPLKEKLGSIFCGKVIVRELKIRDKESAFIPVCIQNPRIFRPFEVFLAALPLPRYGTIDPTPYIALFFPAFFGLIVGDIGYGAVIFILSIYLKRRFRDREMLYNMASVLSVSSLSAIIFGFLFGELFGDLGARLDIVHPILFHRVTALKTFLVLTLGIGIGHVVLGVIIGAVNYLYRGKAKEAGAKLSYLAVIVSFLVVLGIMFGYLPKGFLTPGVIALIVSFVLLTVMEGIIGPLEFIRILGNMLSYVRIMAIGTASVVMALVANKIGGLSENLIVGIIAAGLIHTLNIILGILSPSIQSMRLQYVEFLSKFYEGGGRRYIPFKKR